MNWNLLSKYRAELMGVATIWVVAFHFCEMVLSNAEEASHYANIVGHSFLRQGYLGVEIFLLLSGMSCYYSFCKKNNVIEFYKKRFIKIIIPYFIIAVPFWYYMNLYLEFNIEEFFCNLTGLNLLIGVRTFWYVFLILMMYFIFPILFYFFSKDSIQRYISFILIEGFVILMTYILFVNYLDMYEAVEVLVTRIPIFVYGVYVGKNIYEKKSISWVIIIASIFAVLYLSFDLESDILKRYVNSIQAIGFSLIIVKIFDILDIYQVNINFIKKLLTLIGSYSFEVYLTHIAYRNIFNVLSIPTYSLKFYVIIIFLTGITSVAVKWLANKIDINIFKLKEA